MGRRASSSASTGRPVRSPRCGGPPPGPHRWARVSSSSTPGSRPPSAARRTRRPLPARRRRSRGPRGRSPGAGPPRRARAGRGSRVRAVLAEGPPAAVLLRYADEALLLALGRRPPPGPGPGPVPPDAGGGPVARDCLRHARCPVVVVPGEPALPHGGHGAPGTGPGADGAEPYRAEVYEAYGAVRCGPPVRAPRPPRAAFAAHRH
nr:universal stress protein [Streptomyces sp. MNU89]